ncbi:MAG: HD domain-containing protein [Alistipes sp.]|nr:HD domain-containing protein [Alistipes sp.]
MINNELRQYIEENILPRYDHHDAAHRRDHADIVITQSLKLAECYDVDVNMVYAIAAYHDIGLEFGREHHHTESKRIVLEDNALKQWFTSEQITMMADAVEDHRASAKRAPRTIYGRIVAEADRVIDPRTIIRRTIQFTLTNHPNLDCDQGYERMVEHLNEKYNYGGYLKLWIEESENGKRLEELRQIIADKEKLRRIYDEIYSEEISKAE